jgi:hypothetical protein
LLSFYVASNKPQGRHGHLTWGVWAGREREVGDGDQEVPGIPSTCRCSGRGRAGLCHPLSLANSWVLASEVLALNLRPRMMGRGREETGKAPVQHGHCRAQFTTLQALLHPSVTGEPFHPGLQIVNSLLGQAHLPPLSPH